MQPGDIVFCDPMVRRRMLYGASKCSKGPLWTPQFNSLLGSSMRQSVPCRWGTPATMVFTTGSCRAGPPCRQSPCPVSATSPASSSQIRLSPQNCYDALPASFCLSTLLLAARKSPALIWHASLPAAQKKYASGTMAEQFVTPAECLTRIDRPEMQPMARWSTLIWFSIAQGALARGSIQAGQV